MNVTQDAAGHGLDAGLVQQLYNHYCHLSYLSALAAVLLVGHALRRHRRLSRFRGPPLAAVSDVPHRLAMLGGECHLFYARANNKYGALKRKTTCIQKATAAALFSLGVHVVAKKKKGAGSSACV